MGTLSSVSTAGTGAAVAVGTTLLLVGLALFVRTLLERRSGRTLEERVTELVRDVDLRMRQLGEDLSEELGRMREESRRSRFLGGLAGPIELDEVMRRTLDVAAQLPGADAALMTVLDAAGEPVTTAVGLSEEESSLLAIEGPPKSGRIQSMTIAYSRVGGPDSAEAPPVASSLAVPVALRNQAIGVLSVFSREEFRIFSEASQQALEDLAARAVPALDNARRFQEARRLVDLDGCTGLYNERYFGETLAREVARARRYERRLALIVFDLDDFRQTNDNQGRPAGDAVLRGVADRVREVLRAADIACRVGGDEFAIILPEATLQHAEQLYTRLQRHIAAQPIEPVGVVSLSCGIAELEDPEDAASFFKRADDALYRAKEVGKGRVTLATSTARSISDDVPRSAISDIERRDSDEREGRSLPPKTSRFVASAGKQGNTGPLLDSGG